MRKLLIVVVLLVGLVLPAHAQQVSKVVSATSERHSDGLYYLVLTGDGAEINRICGYGNCSQGFSSPLDAVNAFMSLIGAANGVYVVPIPQPMGGAGEQPFGKPTPTPPPKTKPRECFQAPCNPNGATRR